MKKLLLLLLPVGAAAFYVLVYRVKQRRDELLGYVSIHETKAFDMVKGLSSKDVNTLYRVLINKEPMVGAFAARVLEMNERTGMGS